MIAYNFESNAIIAAPFKYWADKHRLLAYGAIMKRLKDRNMLVEVSTDYKRIIKAEWGVG